jgi:Flp pilus assembly protein TadD
MTCLTAVSRRLLLAAFLASTAVAGPAAPLSAQVPQMVQAVPDPNDPVERLGRYIRVLAGSPRDLDALLGAGQAALDVGDANAALGFYARAEDVAPSSGRVKAGLGSSLVMIERPDDALRLFAEAVSMGVPEAAVARDRGLAYDLRGDSRRAQRDYALALTRQGSSGRDDELVRRYALSLGISGDRAGALAMLDPLLRKQDQGAWRARAFIMAMNGDVSGANGVARQLMVPAMANAMSPLLSRLASLNAAERAHAVNFGTVPSDGTQLAVQTGDPYLGTRVPTTSSGLVSAQGLTRPPVASGDSGLIPSGEPLGPRTVDVKPVRVAQADSTAPRRRPGDDAAPVTTSIPAASPPPAQPGFTTESTASIPSRRIGTRIGPVDPARLPPEARGESGTVVRAQNNALPPPETARPLVGPPAPTQLAQAAAPTAAPPSAAPAAPTSAPPPTDVPTRIEATELPPSTAPAFETPSPTVAVPVSPAAEPPAVPSSSTTAAPVSRLAGLLDGIERESETTVALPGAAELRAARAAAKKKMAQLAAQTAAEDAAKKEAAEKAAASKRNPARVWVQVATGRNDSGLGITLKRIRADNDAALKGLGGWSTPYKATNRILVGPMKSAAAARELVGKLAKNGVSAMTYSSDAGEEVEKIGR